MKRKQLQIWLDEPLWEKLMERMSLSGRSAGDLINQAVAAMVGGKAAPRGGDGWKDHHVGPEARQDAPGDEIGAHPGTPIQDNIDDHGGFYRGDEKMRFFRKP